MKKILSILSVINLAITGTITVVSCDSILPTPQPIPTPDPDPVIHDIKYYQDLYDLTLKDYNVTKQDIDELKSQEMIDQICGGGITICAELQEMIDISNVELYSYNVTMDNCQYQILNLQYDENFTNPDIKTKVLGFLTDELTTLTTIKTIMTLYPTDYTPDDINKIITQIIDVQTLINNLPPNEKR